MKRINLTKYGFKRDSGLDFSDDGNFFYGYIFSDRLHVSKLVSHGEVYISTHITKTDLFYNEFSTLPHYRDLDRLNGVSLDTITEDDIQKLYEDCISFETELKDLESKVIYPTEAEIRIDFQLKHGINVNAYNNLLHRLEQIGTINLLKAFNKHSYYLKDFIYYIENARTVMESYIDEAKIKKYCQPHSKLAREFHTKISETLNAGEEIKPEWYITYCDEILDKII